MEGGYEFGTTELIVFVYDGCSINFEIIMFDDRQFS